MSNQPAKEENEGFFQKDVIYHLLQFWLSGINWLLDAEK